MSDQQPANQLALKGRILWLYLKYQLVSKLLVGLVVLPVFGWFANLLIHASGRTNLSSGDYLGFLFSIYGIPLVIVAALLLVLVTAIDINTFIMISALIQEGKLRMKMRNVLLQAVKSAKYFFSPIGLFLVAYIALVLPLLGFGISLGPLENFKIPNFITSVIFATPLYYAAYLAALTLLTLAAFIYIFTIHYLLIGGQGSLAALRSSRRLMQKHWKAFIPKYLWAILKIGLILLAVAAASTVIFALLAWALSYSFLGLKGATVLLLLSLIELFSGFSFIAAPLLIGELTKLFYQFNHADGHALSLPLDTQASALSSTQLQQKIKASTKIQLAAALILVTGANLSAAVVLENYFEEIFPGGKEIEIVAHRGGGDLGAENSVAGIQTAAAEGVSWTEIDVQRTKDKHYIINHDASFARVAGVDKTPAEMTLAEIKELRIENQFQPGQPAQPVPTLDDILDASKGKIGVFVELKGESADPQMVDEVVAQIKAKNMLDECVILSLDYQIIEYTAKTYPEIKTGYLYFFSVGDLQDLKGDYLIMEEGEATPAKINEIHEAGKKAVVWTVNTAESIDKFTHSDVDGIITDYPQAVKTALQKLKERTPIEVIIDSLL